MLIWPGMGIWPNLDEPVVALLCITASFAYIVQRAQSFAVFQEDLQAVHEKTRMALASYVLLN